MGTVIVGLVVLAVIALVLLSIYRDRKAGKSSCGCKCSSCPMAGKCHSQGEDETKRS